MSHERLCIRAADNRVKKRGLDLEEAEFLHVAPTCGHNFRALLENAFHLGIGNEVDVALAIANFLVGKTMELLGQGAQRFRQELETLHRYRELSAARLHDSAPYADPIAHIEVFERCIGLFSKRVDTAE